MTMIKAGDYKLVRFEEDECEAPEETEQEEAEVVAE